ncbi:hypothetical protein EVAR_46009_1 [Eumeta japonica]|uniref:Uncharacterized protein n=1 Tax=Eumeta variegata TaxID=151549 RepID=A0A4C1X787_EUMVA|nr:hypothetical protein EVAR_46009_1 [Eumeta japonica]
MKIEKAAGYNRVSSEMLRDGYNKKPAVLGRLRSWCLKETKVQLNAMYIEGNRVELLKEFVYLDSLLTDNGKHDRGVAILLLPSRRTYVNGNLCDVAYMILVRDKATRSSRSPQNSVKRGQVALLACMLQMHQMNHISRGCASPVHSKSARSAAEVLKTVCFIFAFKSAERPSVFLGT